MVRVARSPQDWSDSPADRRPWSHGGVDPAVTIARWGPETWGIFGVGV